MASTRDYREHLDEVLKDDAEAVGYLNAALGEEDPEVFLLALRDVARTREGDSRSGFSPRTGIRSCAASRRSSMPSA